MLLAIPVSAADVHLLPKRVEAILKFGPYSNHVLAICPDVTVEQPAKEAMAKLGPLFKQAEYLPVNLNGITGWPLASNKHFKLVAQRINESGIREAFYFFELDNVPMRKGWLDEIHNEYVEANKPYMGCVVPTRGFRNTPNGPVAEDGEPHMVGTGIYPPNLWAYSVKLKTVDRQAFISALPIEPFDVAMRHEVTPSAHCTKLIQHLWRTQNYRKEGDQIVCDDTDGVTANESHKAPVCPNAAVIHGCKDDSLLNLVLKGPPVYSHPAACATAGESAVGSSNPLVAGVQPSDEIPKSNYPSFLGKKIQVLLDGKSMKASDLAKKLEVTIESVKAEVANPNNGLTISGPAQWVKVIQNS